MTGCAGLPQVAQRNKQLLQEANAELHMENSKQLPGNAGTRTFNLNFRKSLSVLPYWSMGKRLETGFEPVRYEKVLF